MIPPTIHLFSPRSYHEEQGIVGNRAGLINLMNLIQVALDNKAVYDSFSTSDGEGYDLYVRCVTEDEEVAMALPYTEDYCKEERKDAIYPWSRL